MASYFTWLTLTLGFALSQNNEAKAVQTVCARDTDCKPNELCFDRACGNATNDDGRMYCDGNIGDNATENPCPIFGAWECLDNMCRSLSIVCRNEAGTCQSDVDAFTCTCWNGDYVQEDELQLDGSPNLSPEEVDRALSQCQKELKSNCGTKRPEPPEGCEGTTRAKCETFSALLTHMTNICPDFDSDGPWPIYFVYDCCNYRNEPENDEGFSCLEAIHGTSKEDKIDDCETLLDEVDACIAKFPNMIYPGDVEDDDDDDDDDDDSDANDESTEGTSESDESGESSQGSTNGSADGSDGANSSEVLSDMSDTDGKNHEEKPPAATSVCSIGSGGSAGPLGMLVLSGLIFRRRREIGKCWSLRQTTCR